MKRFKIILSLLVFILVSSCENNEIPTEEEPIVEEPTTTAARFSVDTDYILKDEIPFKIKGVVYVPGYPGYLPWEIENSSYLPLNLRRSIDRDIANIKKMGANTVRFWGAPQYCYEALKKTGDLYFLQTIWLKNDEADFQDPAFKETSKAYIRKVINRIHTVFDDTPPIIAYIVGNELSEASILSTDAAHPEIHHYTGQYIVTASNITATEAFVAEMADYTKTYAFETYGYEPLVSYANEIRTEKIIDTPFLDFICHNAYAYAVPYYRPTTTVGSTSGTIFQGWVEEIKSKHPNLPLLITETGLSVSPNAYHAGPPNYGYGGNTEEEQVTGLLQNITDINTTALPTAGVCIHEYLDAWWKFSLQDSYSQDPDDIEEWFGMVKLKSSNDWYTTEFRDSYHAVKDRWNNQ